MRTDPAGQQWVWGRPLGGEQSKGCSLSLGVSVGPEGVVSERAVGVGVRPPTYPVVLWGRGSAPLPSSSTLHPPKLLIVWATHSLLTFLLLTLKGKTCQGHFDKWVTGHTL